MKDLPLTGLRALAAVKASGGLRPAGRLLQVQHSAVSRALRDLQAWLDVPLFESGQARRGLRLTPEGERLAREALEAFETLDAAVLRLREDARPTTVTIAAPPSFAVRWLLPRLPALQRARPRLELSVLVDQARKSPVQADADLSVRMGSRPDSDLPVLALMDECVFPVASPSHPALKRRRRAGHGDHLFEGLPLLHDRDPGTAWATWKRQFGPADWAVRRGARFTSSDLLLQAAEQGQGVALARGRLAAGSLADGRLVRLDPTRQIALGDDYWLILNPRTAWRSAVRDLLGWLAEEAGRPLVLPADVVPPR